VDIENYYRLSEMFGGVRANDEMKRPDPHKIYILNLQNSAEPGSHWTLLYNHWYFDSYGVAPTKEIQPFVKAWNQNEYQSLPQESCGYYAMYVADNIMAGRPPTQGLVPGKYLKNQRTLKQHFFGFPRP
jgi:hypothetical protein